MSTHKLSPQAEFDKLKARIILKFNTGNIKTYRSYLHSLNYGDSLIAYINYPQQQLEEPLDRKRLNELLSGEEWRRLHNQYDYRTKASREPTKVRVSSNENETGVIQDREVISEQDKKSAETHGQITSYKPDSFHPKQTARLIHKQEDAARQLLDGLLLKDLHGQLLLAAAGKGKTFILGAVIRRILDHPTWLTERSIAPWKIAYITKASIVEQTRRVLANLFGIDTDNECIVINIDQLRATFGEMFIRWNTKVTDGVATLTPEWKPLVYPCLFIIDESQTVKNEDSLQSQVIQAATEITDRYPDKPVYFIQSSATPFTCIAESKTFVLSCRIPLDT